MSSEPSQPSEPTPNRSIESEGPGLGDYLTQFRERIWLFLAVFFLIFLGSALYTFNASPIYKATATLEILRDDPNILGIDGADIERNQVLNIEDFRTQVNVLESATMIRKVASRLKADELERFMAPYRNVIRLEGPFTPEEVLGQNRKISPIRQSLTVGVSYTHPEPEMAARVANLFVKEFIERNLSLNVSGSIDAVDGLEIRRDQQRQQVDQLERDLANFREEHNTVSFDERADIDHQELRSLNEILINQKRDLDEMQAQLNMLEDFQEEGRNLWDLPFIGDMPQVSNLLSKLSVDKVEVAGLMQRYRAKHPKMIQAMQSLVQTETELKEIVTSAAEKIRSLHRSTYANYESIRERMEAKEKEILNLGKVRVQYNSMERDLDVAKTIYQGILQRLEVEIAQVDLKKPNARVIDNAYPPSYPSSPNHKVNLALGLIGGLGFGFALVFVLAFSDDRVKSTLDVEGQLGLNVLNLMPKSIRMDSFKRARIAQTNLDPRIAEGFRSLYSTLRISDVGKHSQVIITTSTLPSEGKSFVASNLAFTFASHGEKTLLIDADFRMPSLAAALKLEKQVKEAGNGLVGYFEGTASWEDMIVPGVDENLDLLASVNRASTPSEVANSSHFIDIINALRERYDRIIVDTPPMGIVSDALALVPAVDACLYIIKHKGVKIRNIRTSLRRLDESHMPVLGAIMNHVDKLGATYYHNYYDGGKHHYYGAYDKKVGPSKKKKA